MPLPPHHHRAAFTMVQLLVVILVVATLVAILIPVIQHQRELAERQKYAGRIKLMALALHDHNDTYRRLPPAFDSFGKINFPASLHVHLLPYLEYEPAHQQFRLGNGTGKVQDFIIPPFLLLEDYSREKPEGIQNFAANLRFCSTKGINAKFDEPLPPLGNVEPGIPGIPGTFFDGISNTIVFATKLAVCGKNGGSRYAAPVNNQFAAFFGQNPAQVRAGPTDAQATFQLAPNASQCLSSPLMAQSFDTKGLMVGVADGSVRTIKPNISPDTWNKLLQPNDGNKLGDDWD